MHALLSRLLEHMAWADRRVIESVRAAPAAAQAEALPLLAHLLAAGHVWLSRLEGREPRHAVWPKLSLDACAALAAENEAGYRALIHRLGEADLATPVQYRTSQGQPFVTPVGDILAQVVTHGPYHRGQIARCIVRAGGTPAAADFILFSREG